MHNYRCLQVGVLAFGLTITAAQVHAWSADGHETVGKLGAALIAGTNAEAKVQDILGMSLEQAAVWADCAKGVNYNKQIGTFAYQRAGQYPECQPFETEQGKREMVAFVRRNWVDCHPGQGEEVCHKQYHYTDVTLQRDQYTQGLTGTSDHDVVAAIRAAILVLQGSTSPAPMQFANKREALLVLTHYVGDIHQPLHVASVYLDAQGQVVDPDRVGFNPTTRTIGGNSIQDGRKNLHHEWDTVPAALKSGALGISGVDEARAIPASAGDLISWPAQWATDTLISAGPAFAGATYSAEDGQKHWDIAPPAGYTATRETVQRAQLLKAGARLAQLLNAIWP
ncbi:S1/P1 nuclease [Cupriavidus sp. UYPR2.512]|uniref:S1/P1 nuclease n=1 Tax=Cupriavidus sp. UYPR2.512 TaxID=1080187 RepID=UPI00037CCD45|nr:S1/P1 nuclease [Cupriavidus sp. UYPR2.512]UIF89310.1 S1/P1 nuclease [Cupriavidus necator]